MSDPWTLTARDIDGAEITFTDYASDGMRVDLWDDPEIEIGFRSARIVYHEGADWRLREPTEKELAERFLKIRQHLGLEPGGVPSGKPRNRSPFAGASRDSQGTNGGPS